MGYPTEIAMAVIGTVGAIEYLKGWLPKAPKWVWRAALPVIGAGIAYSSGGTLGERLITGLVIVTFSEIGYQTVVQSLTGLLKALLEKIKAGLGHEGS